MKRSSEIYDCIRYISLVVGPDLQGFVPGFYDF